MLQALLKKEAAASAVEEQLREKEAVEAENAAALAKIAENESMVHHLPPEHLQLGPVRRLHGHTGRQCHLKCCGDDTFYLSMARLGPGLPFTKPCGKPQTSLTCGYWAQQNSVGS